MDYIFKTDNNTKQIIYTLGDSVLTRRIQGQLISRPVLLSKDFASSLNAVIMNDTLYYSYIDLSSCLCVKNSLSPAPIYKSDSNDNAGYINPCLAVANGELVLLYCEGVNDICESDSIISNGNNFGNNTYKIRYIVSPEKSNNTLTSGLDISFSSAPLISAINTSSENLFCVCCNSEWHLFGFTSKFDVISYCSDTHSVLAAKDAHINKIENKLTDQAAQIENLKTKIFDKDSQICTMKDELVKKGSQIRNMKDEITDKNTQIETIKKELSIRNAQIESAKVQYNELMDVATRYRDEATKWRMRLASK